VPILQLSVRNSYTELHENLPNGSVANARSWTDTLMEGWVLLLRNVFLLRE